MKFVKRNEQFELFQKMFGYSLLNVYCEPSGCTFGSPYFSDSSSYIDIEESVVFEFDTGSFVKISTYCNCFGDGETSFKLLSPEEIKEIEFV